MTGLVRKAMLFGVLGLLAASSAFAFVPDPVTSSVPNTIFVATTVQTATDEDTDGANGAPYNVPGPVQAFTPGSAANQANVITIRDFSTTGLSGVNVHIVFPCDVELCASYNPGAPYTTAPYLQTITHTTFPDGRVRSVLHGVTDAGGRFEFLAIGAAEDPGGVVPAAFGGRINPLTFNATGAQPANHTALVYVDGYGNLWNTVNATVFEAIGAACYDQNGAVATGPASFNGNSGLDISVVQSLALSAGGGQPHRGRGDLDGSGANSGIDISFMQGHVLRLTPLQPTAGCPPHTAAAVLQENPACGGP
jgi:hypothetical protein